MVSSRGDVVDRIKSVVEETGKGVVVTVVVHPRSSSDRLVLEGDELVYYTCEPPLHGRANASLIKFFSKTIGIPVSKIGIVYGYRSRVKKLLITDTCVEEVVEAIAKAVVVE